jgi:hypothetical protein
MVLLKLKDPVPLNKKKIQRPNSKQKYIFWYKLKPLLVLIEDYL